MTRAKAGSENDTFTRFKCLRTGVVWEVAKGSEAYRRCKRLITDYEEVADSQPEIVL